MNPWSETTNPERKNNFKSKCVLETYMDELMLIDIWRAKNESVRSFTWCKPKPYTASRLDMFIINYGITQQCKTTIEPGFSTDHSLISLTILHDHIPRGKGYWKFNTMHLSDINFLHKVNEELDQLKASFYKKSPQQRLEEVVELITKECKAWSIQKACNQKVDVKNILEKIHKLKLKIENEKDTRIRDELLITKQNYESKYDKYETMKTRGAAIRSRAKWYSEGEKSSKYFLGLEKLKHSNKTMKCLIKEDGSILRDQKKILLEQLTFYRKLYKSNPEVFFDYENDTNKKLTPEDKAFLDRDIELDELSQALYSMPNNKAPGYSGLQAEVYKVFWSKIKLIYYLAIQACIQEKILTPGMRKGLLCLIPKKQRDPSYLKNWRPLTLMSISHKFFVKAIALRIKPVLQYLISNRQTGYMEKRFIGLNLRKIIDIIEYCNESNTSALMISIDFLKCFDMIEFCAIEGAMKFFDFGEKIISYVRLLYTKFQTAIIHNGFISTFFTPTRGIHQGCAQSGYNFLLNAEILAEKISRNPKIAKIQINQNPINPVSQFVNDLTLFTLPDQESLEEIVRIFDEFQQKTGLTISYEKSVISRLGPIRNTSFKLKLSKKFKWHDTNLIALGIALDKVSNENDSFSDVLETMNAVLKTWQQRKLSLNSKITILNSLVGSLLVYKMQVLPTISGNLARKINQIIENFIWNGRKPKI